MTIRNTSRYPTAVVRALVLFAARAMLVEAWDLVVHVTSAGVVLKGQFWEGTVSIGIGPTDLFPVFPRAYVRGAPRVLQVDWREALVATAAHEFAHARQDRERRGWNEVEAEHAARGALVVFRGERVRRAA